MSVDFQKLKEKLNKINKKEGKLNYFKPDPKVGTYTVRLVPYKSREGLPWEEISFYYGIGKQTFMALSPLGKKDPVQELISELYADGTKEAKEKAKTLFPKKRLYVPVIVRGQEEKGVQIWAFSPGLEKKIMAIMFDSDFGDITDPLEGRDLKLTVTQAAGVSYPTTDPMPAGKVTPLSKDRELVTRWIESVPNIYESFKEPSYDELSTALKNWLAGTTETVDASHSEEENSNDLGAEPTSLRRFAGKTAVAGKPASGSAAPRKTVESELQDFLTNEQDAEA